MKIHGWGRYPIADVKVTHPKSQSECLALIQDGSAFTPRGMGRSYGDSANGLLVMQSNHLDHYIYLDEQNGVLSCEAGVLICDILQLIVPKGWFLPVTPGTSFVSIGGAIASDVHGKNHHLGGTFSEHVLSFNLVIGTGETLRVSKENYADLFRATCGGMGLTGFILSAVIQLKQISSSNIIQTTIKASCLEQVCEQFEENTASPYSVAWIDCLAKGKKMGRSLLVLGEHDTDGCLNLTGSKVINIPFVAPSGLLNHHTIKAFNAIYYQKNFFKLKKETLPLKTYFYPLDSIGGWNRLYGKAGFVQFQFVLPKNIGVRGLKQILSCIVDGGKASFLAVLKVFGPSNENFLSFPIEGYTLALDFQVTPETLVLIHRLEDMVVHMGGRIYLTKDALMTEKSFKASYSQWEKFEQVRACYGAHGKFVSNQSIRLGLQ